MNISQEQLDDAIVKYIINGIQIIIKRWTLRNKFGNDFLEQRRKITMEFKNIESIALTFDIQCAKWG